jgi:hypothetical protein
MAEAIIRVTGEDNPPLRLPLGEEAFGQLRKRLAERCEELDRVEPLGLATALTT